MLNKPVFRAKLALFIVLMQHTAWQGCSRSRNQPSVSQTITPEKQLVARTNQARDIKEVQEENIKFEVIGTVTKINIQDLSKRAGIKKLYTYITIKVKKPLPENIASQLKSKELKFTQLTNTDIDLQISAGNQVIVTVVANDLSKPEYFAMYDLKKIPL